MIEQLNALETEAIDAVQVAADESSLRDLEVRFLGKKGEITALLKGMRDVAAADRPKIGQRVNEVRGAVQGAIETRRTTLEADRIAALCEDPHFDATLPGKGPTVGALHPLTQVTYHIEDVFRAMGFISSTTPK